MAFSMVKLILKWAFKKPATSQYPFTPRTPVSGSRGKLVFMTDTCIYCKICEKKCPTDALVVDRVTKTWGIDRLRCISCGACVEGCPKKSLQLSEMHEGPAVTRDREFPFAPTAGTSKAVAPVVAPTTVTVTVHATEPKSCV